ncbi:MAG TPA: tRNA glutamyl-Q(34) synthetase GluQRS [Fontimonas sp.]
MTETPTYRGRFAPTPSGPLHLGSLLTALAGWLEARTHRGTWMLRIDDLDAPRCVPGADQEILQQLEVHGLIWDGAPRYQSQHLHEYAAARDGLQAGGQLYACDCTRARLQAESLPGPVGRIYSGRCRERGLPLEGHALRLRVGAEAVVLDDPWQGLQRRDPPRALGDFVVWRRDGIPGYALACVVDDLAMQISHVVRGADLLDASLQQKLLMREIGATAPSYAHLPVLGSTDGRKLSKQNHAPALVASDAARNLRRCLDWLGQQAPPAAMVTVADILQHALQHWRAERVPRTGSLAVEQCV